MKALDSFAGLLLGWLAATLVAGVVSMAKGTGLGLDFLVVPLIAGVVALAGWLLFILPAVYLLSAQWALRTPLPKVALIGGGYGVLMYALMVCTWTWRLWPLVWFPAILIAVTAVVFARLQRLRAGGNAPPQTTEFREQHPQAAKLLLTIPLIAAAALTSLIWLVDVKHTATCRARWSICDPRSSPFSREGIPTVQITVIDGPPITMYYSSARIHDYLVTLPTNEVDVVAMTITDFGRIRAYNIERIGDLPPKFDPNE